MTPQDTPPPFLYGHCGIWMYPGKNKGTISGPRTQNHNTRFPKAMYLSFKASGFTFHTQNISH